MHAPSLGRVLRSVIRIRGIGEIPLEGFLEEVLSVSRRGGRNKGEHKQMRVNANKPRQTLTNADKRREMQRRKRKQTRANVDKRKQALTPPLIVVFTPPFAIPLFSRRFVLGQGCLRALFREQFPPP